MQITLVRHGQSVSNAAGIWQGHSNSELSELGVSQAGALAARLGRISEQQSAGPFTQIVSSDLRRAHHTARLIGEAVGMPVRTNPSWREIHLGTWEGLTSDEVAARYPDEVAALGRGEDIPVGGAERWSDLGRRVGAAFEELGDGEDHVLVVAHGGVIITLLSGLLGVMRMRPRLLGKLSNTSITSLQRTPDGVFVDVYNDGLHVDEQATWRREVAEKNRPLVRLEVGAEGDESIDLPAAFESRADRLHVSGRALQRWAEAQLPGERRATPSAPLTGSRSLSTGRLPGGTLWT